MDNHMIEQIISTSTGVDHQPLQQNNQQHIHQHTQIHNGEYTHITQ